MSVVADWQGRTLTRIGFWAAGLFSFVMAVLPHPPEVPGHPSGNVQHIIAFVTLALLGAWAFPVSRLTSLLVRLSAYGAVIELIQAIPSLHRDSNVLDWLVDTISAGVVLIAIHLVRRRTGA